MWVSTAKRL